MHDSLIIAGFFLMVLSPCLVGLHAANSEVSMWVALRRFGMRRTHRASRRVSLARGRVSQTLHRVMPSHRVMPLRPRTPRPARWTFAIPRLFSRLRSRFSLRRIRSVVRFARLGFQMSSRGRRLSNLTARH